MSPISMKAKSDALPGKRNLEKAKAAMALVMIVPTVVASATTKLLKYIRRNGIGESRTAWYASRLN